MRFAELDAVTVDGYGTLLELADPVPALGRALDGRGIERSSEDLASAFAAEGRHYRARAHHGRAEASLAELRRECVAVFLDELGVGIEPASFVDAFIGALTFEPVPGAVDALQALRDRDLALGVVANWDCMLPEHLARLGLDRFFSAIVTSAEAGVPKPDPAIFRLALERLGASAERALHVGDEQVDEEGARATGMRFAPAPLQTAFQDWR